MGRICAFEAKKTDFFRRTFAVNRCGKRNKKFLHFFDFPLALSTLLGENLPHFDGLAVTCYSAKQRFAAKHECAATDFLLDTAGRDP